MKVAVAQVSCALGDITANLKKVRVNCAAAKEAGADLIIFPEMTDTGYNMAVIQASASSWTTGAVPDLMATARELSLAIVCGVSEREGSAIYNSQILVNANGGIVAKYRKAHLFSLSPIEERRCFSPGNQLVCVEQAGWRFGMSICYDLRFPELYRTLATRHQANAFFISSAWPFPRVEHFRTLAAARAIENQSYVLAANRVGTDAGATFCGNSTVIDPTGSTIARASADREELLLAELAEDVLRSVREKMEVFSHRREDLYSQEPTP